MRFRRLLPGVDSFRSLCLMAMSVVARLRVWPGTPRKDRDARWTVKYSKAKPSEDGAKRVDLTIPTFGYKNHIAIDRVHRLIRT